MRIRGEHWLVLIAALALTACGGGDEGNTVAGKNLPPIIEGTPVTTLAAGATYTFTPKAADPDGDTLTFKASNVPAWAKFDQQTGALTGTPGEADVGTTDPIVIEVTDSRAVAQLPAFRITVASNISAPEGNSPPTILGTPATTATVGRVYSFVPVGDDADDDALSYSIVNRPSWATFTEATGELRGTPSNADVGTTNDIVIYVTDGEEIAQLPAFNLTVTATPPPENRPPTITGNPPTTATVGRRYSFRPVGADPDGDTLIYSIQNRPSWAQFSTTTGRLWGTPTAGSVGTSARITISVADSASATPVALPSFTIQVSAQANRAPVISGTPPTTVGIGSAYSFQPSASDADGNTLTFSITNLPSWASFNTSTGRLTGTPGAGNVGDYAGIVISVSDGTASASLPAFTLRVVQTSNGTATVNWTPPTQNTDGSTLSDLSGYRVVYGRSSNSLDQSATVNNPGITSYVVNNLTSGTWYFAVRSINSLGAESDLSNIASKTIP